VRKLIWNTRKGKPSSPKDGGKRTVTSPENTDWTITIKTKRGNKNMRKFILTILVTFITMMAASAEWRSVRTTEDCGSYGIVQFDYQFDDEMKLYDVEDITTFYNKIQEIVIPGMKEDIKYVQKDILYTKGCEYAKVHGACFFQNSLGIKDVIILQPNGYYTVISLK
jgi:hypothetical protein